MNGHDVIVAIHVTQRVVENAIYGVTSIGRLCTNFGYLMFAEYGDIR